MLTKIEIENFKSIYKETIELGRVNVFIGENGCGKTNILEAVGMASASLHSKLSNDELALTGIRVTKPSITFSSFQNQKSKKYIGINCHFQKSKEDEKLELAIKLKSLNSNDINSQWKDVAQPTSTTEEEKRVEKAFKTLFSEIGIDKTNELLDGDKNLFHAFVFSKIFSALPQFKIYNLSTQILRGINPISREIPGIHGENLDLLISSFNKIEFNNLLNHSHFISWLKEIVIDREDTLKLEGHKLDMSQSTLYFRDKFMQKKNNIFSAENANEGILHILFYLALFISKRTPKFFAIDNIETALNPYLCTALMEELVKLAKKNDKQVLITTHNPAILDGLDLHDDEVRLFVVSRDFKGHTRVERKKLKPDVELNGKRLKLSELWMRGHLGAIPQHF